MNDLPPAGFPTLNLNGGGGGDLIELTASPNFTASASLNIDGQGGSDGIIMPAMSAGCPSLTINGGAGDDSVLFNGPIPFYSGANLNVDFQNDDAAPGTDIMLFNTGALLQLSGSGSATLRCSQNIYMSTGSGVTVTNGALTAEANQQATATTGNFNGITVDGAILGTVSAGTGNVVVKGRGGE